MPDPVTISLASVGSAAITEGIKFLYGQAGDLLKRWRERKDEKQGKKELGHEPDTAAVDTSLPPAIFAGQLESPRVHFDALNASVKQLSELRQDLTPYIDGIQEFDARNADLLARVDLLRNLLESVYRQRITFKGESRPPSGVAITVTVDAGKVFGDAAALRSRELRSGTVHAEASAESVEAGGRLTGAEIDRIG